MKTKKPAKKTPTPKQLTCEQRIKSHLQSRVADLRECFKAYQEGKDEHTFPEYGLSFDYVANGTFRDQEEPYFRYQLSWGGPSDEFRFFATPSKRRGEWEPYRIEYWFMDWHDGASRRLFDDDRTLMNEIFAFFSEIGSAQAEFVKAMEE